MFTGIVEEKGIVRWIDQIKGAWILVIESSEGKVLNKTQLGDSIAVSGVCLTVTAIGSGDWEVEGKQSNLMWFGCAPETMRRTCLGNLTVEAEVNLERAVSWGQKMGGHFVEGHVDGTGSIVKLERENESLWVYIEVNDQKLMQYIVEKGYIAIDGTSLTVCGVDARSFSVMLVSYTQEKVVLAKKQIGDLVNLEVDILAKYVEKAMSQSGASGVSVKAVELLHEHLQ